MYRFSADDDVLEQDISRGRGVAKSAHASSSNSKMPPPNNLSDQNSQVNHQSLVELIAVMKSFDRRDPPEATGMVKHVSTIIVAAILALGIWVVSGLSSMQATLGGMEVTINSTAKTTIDVQQDIRALTQGQSNMQADLATLKSRVDAMERATGVRASHQ